MVSVLMALREEVLAQVSERLPPAARVLDLVLRQQDKDARVQVGRWPARPPARSSHAPPAAGWR
jgi:hypothetical protein